MLRAIIYSAIGYLSGSILFAPLFGRLLNKQDIVDDSPDRNPGTYNAFQYGGFLCGVLTLCGDILKGFIPIYFFSHGDSRNVGIGLAFVLAAPVFGHILPIFFGFHGGKGIAVSFGGLLGLLPEYRPLLILASFFLFFSLVLKITPNYHRTLITYLCSVTAMMFFLPNTAISLGFVLIAGAILLKLFFSDEKKEKCKVGIVWKH